MQPIGNWNGSGRIKRDDEWKPRDGAAHFNFRPDGSVLAFTRDWTTGELIEWQGRRFANGWTHLHAPALGPLPVTACGWSKLRPDQTVSVALAMGGSIPVPFQTYFTLTPY